MLYKPQICSIELQFEICFTSEHYQHKYGLFSLKTVKQKFKGSHDFVNFYPVTVFKNNENK